MREPWNALEKRAEAGVVSSSCSVARAADGLRWIGGQTSVWGDPTRGRNTLHCIMVVELSGGIHCTANQPALVTTGHSTLSSSPRWASGRFWPKTIRVQCWSHLSSP